MATVDNFQRVALRYAGSRAEVWDFNVAAGATALPTPLVSVTDTCDFRRVHVGYAYFAATAYYAHIRNRPGRPAPTLLASSIAWLHCNAPQNAVPCLRGSPAVA